MPARVVVDCLAKDATGQVLGVLDKHIRSA
jgi:hypothetical protein